MQIGWDSREQNMDREARDRRAPHHKALNSHSPEKPELKWH